ncbi:extensin family protein [Aliiroseovarius sp.]|uniref:extensin-like domain-containing protein n=1 Tax=Aliiroseovarius sp. TaxID=1872442 RepID=UPI003BAAC2BC
MKSLAALVVTLTFSLVGQAVAYAPATSPRPIKRPGTETVAPPIVGSVATATAEAPRRSPRPQRRPGSRVVTTAAIETAVTQATGPVTEAAVSRSPRPKRRPAVRTATVATPAPTPVSETRTRRQSRRGSVCGVREIRGQKIDPIPGRLPGCGISDAVRVTEIAGVTLSQASVMDCDTAKALNRWVETGVKPAVGRLGGGLSSLRVAAHYSCRTRNNQPGAKISEHGKGHAIDISGFVLKNGVTISVLNGWRDPVQGKVLKAAHAAACGPFGTVLGPNADRYHQDHLHMDTARHRGGSYCR